MAARRIFVSFFGRRCVLAENVSAAQYDRPVGRKMSHLALLYSFFYFLDLDLAKSFDFEKSLARSSMNRLARANYQLYRFCLARLMIRRIITATVK